MVRLNKNTLPKSSLENLFKQLSQTLGKLNAAQTELALSELLGPEEKIMLAKRLGIMVLLTEGHSLYNIARTLKVSPATAAKIKERLNRNQCSNLQKMLQTNKKDYLKILDLLDSILTLDGNLPRYSGKDRYRHL